ncbi:MAG: hypothetical protein IPP38_01920 [Bacteroidetes bacterium]|nr:hypothetical protein [Bacteroidota bacterium]
MSEHTALTITTTQEPIISTRLRVHFTDGPNMVYKVPGEQWFASAAPDVLLQGSLYVNGGTVKSVLLPE